MIKRRTLFKFIGIGILSSSVTSRAAALKQSPASSGTVDARLQALGINLPPIKAPVGAYVPYRIVGNIVHITQVPRHEKGIVTGMVGKDISTRQGYDAARLCAIGALSTLKEACGGNLDRVKQCIQIQGYVNCSADFTEQHVVSNGFSELLRDVFGEAGLGARNAVGTNSLPLGMAFQVYASFELAD